MHILHILASRFKVYFGAFVELYFVLLLLQVRGTCMHVKASDRVLTICSGCKANMRELTLTLIILC